MLARLSMERLYFYEVFARIQKMSFNPQSPCKGLGEEEKAFNEKLAIPDS